ncbi:hypothetical protein V5O48_006468 [Marasmius crinis-equi]|uniref:Uncharacterized protein n=1 Tax=Marasmius crinis-equi TaxID=585013 RepID=A0ABR3FJG2_9AGAR
MSELIAGGTNIPQDRDLADHHHDDEEETVWVQSPKSKGKQREREDSSSSLEDQEDTMEYPPGINEAEETRRVEETLRRWEAAEQLRRKAARESYNGSTKTNSIVSASGWRASSLWGGSGQSRHRALGGNHAALESRDSMDQLPLDDMAPSPGFSPRASPTPPESTNEHNTDNPFLNPPEASSPFADSHQVTALMSPTTPPETLKTTGDALPPDRPTLKAAESTFGRPPPPEPLGLPPPRTPPPIEQPPEPVPAPTIHQSPQASQTEEPETRWWHEWLCGCGEGPDRGGDYQASVL